MPYQRKCSKCPVCGQLIRVGICGCNRVIATDPSEAELNEMRQRNAATGAALADDAAEIARRFAQPDGHEHESRPLVFSSETRLSEIETPKICGLCLNGTCFLQEAVGCSPKSGKRQRRPNSRSKRQESEHGCQWRHGRNLNGED